MREGSGADRRPRLLILFTTVAGFGLLSNVLGYLRETALAASYGSSSVTDAFFAAAFIPNTLYMIIASGAGAAILVPVLVEYREKGGQEARELALTLVNLATLSLLVLTLLLTLTSSLWVGALFPGFAPATRDLSIHLAYILNPTVIFLSVAAVLAGVLNAFGHFGVVALAPCVGNIVTILVICLSTRWGGIQGAAFGVALGGMAQLLIMAWMTFAKATPYRRAINLAHPGLKAFARMAVPTMAYLAVAYLSLTAERIFASGFAPGAMSTLSYAMRLFVLPASIVAGSIATVLHPEFSALAGRGDLAGLGDSFRHGAELTILALVPVCVGAVVLRHAIVAVAYGYGKFSHQNIETTAATFAAYSLGILPLALTMLCQRVFYATRVPRVPLMIECVALAVYLIAAPILGRQFHLPGLALARSGIFLLVGALSLAFALRRLEFRSRNGWLASQLARCGLAVIPTAALWLGFMGQFHRIDQVAAWARLVVLGGVGVAGLALYLFVARLFRCREADTLFRTGLDVLGIGGRMRSAREVAL